MEYREDLISVMFALGIADFVVFLVATSHLIFLFWQDRKEKVKLPRKGEKVFHMAIMICMLMRAIFFGLQPFILQGNVQIADIYAGVWSQTNYLLFVLVYFMLFVVWMNFYYIIEGSISATGTLVVFILCGFVVLLVPGFIITAIVWAILKLDATTFEVAVSITFSIIIFILALGVLSFGVRLYTSIQLLSKLSDTKRRQSWQVSLIILICTLAYVIRACLVMVRSSSLGTLERGHNMEMSWWSAVMYFTLLETFPLSLMVILLWFIPSWKEERQREEDRVMLLMETDY